MICDLNAGSAFHTLIEYIILIRKSKIRLRKNAVIVKLCQSSQVFMGAQKWLLTGEAQQCRLLLEQLATPKCRIKCNSDVVHDSLLWSLLSYAASIYPNHRNMKEKGLNKPYWLWHNSKLTEFWNYITWRNSAKSLFTYSDNICQ